MKKQLIILIIAMAMCTSALNAMSPGLFGSLWNQRDDDDALGAGVLLLPSTLPLEFRATYYERSSDHKLRAIPLDFGLNFVLTRIDTVVVTAVGGGTYYILDRKNASEDNEFGWYAGGRLELPLHRTGNALFGELLYRGADFDNPNLNFSGVTINLGFIF